MLLSLQSTNEDYATIRSSVHIPWSCKYVKYWISCVNFNANMYCITDDDYIVLNGRRIQFHNATSMNQQSLLAQLNTNGIVNFRIENKQLQMTVLDDDVVFTDITPRAKMISGLSNVKLNQPYEGHGTTHIFDIPVYDYGNKLYIVSKYATSVQSNIGDQEYSPGILASIDTVIRDGLPVIVNFETYGKPIKNETNIESFSNVEMQLVDSMFQPVKLLSPMFVCIKVKPIYPPRVKLS